ncbi:MAG: TIGR04219 family outer membrane beta-barrel protein [Candidatus Polarisedimenticolaceae bacterium]|nr:TIGR04219 family outer membrane beta-barrel protein [Candidatus Polarisedimenticolaceae bacterium]
MKIRILPGLFLLLCTSAAHADFAGVTIGGAIWNHQPSGDFSYSEDGIATDIDFDDTLGLSTEAEGFFWLAIEHPIPFLPNLKLQRTQLSSEGEERVTQSVTFGDQIYTAGTDVKSSVSLNQTDIILYYEFLDNVVSFDAGLNIKIIDAEFELTSSLANESVSETLYVPMLYAAARVDLPLTGVYLGGSGSLISMSGSSFSDYQFNVGYESAIGLGVEGGYRMQTLKIDDVSDLNTNFKFDGAYLGLFYHF